MTISKKHRSVPLLELTVSLYPDGYSVLHPSFGGTDAYPVRFDQLIELGLIRVPIDLLPEVELEDKKT